MGPTGAGLPSWGQEEVGRISTSSEVVSPPSLEARKDDSCLWGLSRAPHNPRIMCAVGTCRGRESLTVEWVGVWPLCAPRETLPFWLGCRLRVLPEVTALGVQHQCP